MINYIKKWLGFSKDNNNLSDTNTENQIIISCDQTGMVKVKITISNLDANAAVDFGKTLFLINEGFYVQFILDILEEMKNSDANHAEFVEQIIATWSGCVVNIESLEKDADNQPIVSPTLFDKGLKQQ